MDKEITILLPAYNEEDNVELMVSTWEQQKSILKEKYNLLLKIIVINDGSKDNTQKICESLCQTFDNFTLINHTVNKGLGEAIKTGILYTIERCPNTKYVCIMDCDNTQDPKYIIDMLDKIGENQNEQVADVVIASRYQKGSEVLGVAKHRLFTSEGAKYVYCAILNVKNVKDYTCGYRLYSKDILQRCYSHFNNEIIEESGFTCMAELLYKLHIVGARFAEIPFILRYDCKLGQSKMKVLKTAINSIKLAFRLRRLNK